MMQFGLTQFGMTTIGAITLVTGAALATADIAGHNEVTKIFSGTGAAYATVTGYGRRAANQLPVTAYAYGQANNARAKVTFNPLPSTALCTAVANIAQAKVDFMTYGFGSAGTATGYGDSRRLTKIYPLRAEAVASGEGDPQTWQMAYASPAVATAIGFGTTYHLVYGNAVCTATIEDHPRLQIGGHGTAVATCVVNQPVALFQIGAKGLAEAFCTVQGDPAVKRAGIRYFEVNGDALAMAIALSTHVGVTQSQTGYGVCTAEGHVRYTFGGKGQGICTAVGYGNAETMGTGASLNAGNTTAYGTGRAQLNAQGKGSAACSATGYGSGEKKQTRVQAASTTAVAVVSTPAGVRTSLVSGFGLGQALPTTLFVVFNVQPNPGQAVANLSTPAINLQLNPPAAQAMANVSGYARKFLYAEGLGQASASASGYNEINDLVPAPVERTVVVEAFERIVHVAEEPRLILV
jgi:hypothetical protein